MNHFSRESGVLLHLTSLPGPHGIGDLGQSAFQFIDQLKQMGQKLWQILPTGQPDNFYSPYSTISAFCNNPLLISLDYLCEAGFIKQEDLGFVLFASNEFGKVYANMSKKVDWVEFPDRGFMVYD